MGWMLPAAIGVGSAVGAPSAIETVFGMAEDFGWDPTWRLRRGARGRTVASRIAAAEGMQDRAAMYGEEELSKLITFLEDSSRIFDSMTPNAPSLKEQLFLQEILQRETAKLQQAAVGPERMSFSDVVRSMGIDLM